MPQKHCLFPPLLIPPRLWGSQSWLPPAFSRRLPGAKIRVRPRKSPLKGGCRQNCLPHTISARDRVFLELFRRFPRRSGVRQDLRVYHAIDLPVEVDRALEAGVGAAVIVVVKLLALHARLLHRVLLLDAGTEDRSEE